VIGVITRRRLLRAASAAGAGGVGAALLAACGGSVATTVTTTSSAASAASPTTAAVASSSSVATSASVSTAVTSSAATRVGSAATTATLTTSASAATSVSAAAAATGAPAGKPGSLQVVSRRTGGSDALKKEQALYDDFSKEHPDIHVDVSGGNDTEQVVLTRHAGGSPIDFFENDFGTWSDLSSKGVVAELTPYFATAKISLSIYAPQAVQNYTLQGKTYGLPVSMSVDALAYNVDLFDTNGLPHPPVDPKDPTWTMEKFQEVAQKLTNGTDQFGFGGSANGYDSGGITDGTYFGMPGWDDAARKSRYDTPEWAKGAQYWLDLRNKYKVQPNADQVKTLRASFPDVFVSGKVGMNVVYAISWKPEQIHFKWALATIPYSGTGNNISGRMYPHGLQMEATSPNKDKVWTIFQWLTVPANGGRYPLITGHFVSPILNGGSDLAQKDAQQRLGIDAHAFVLESYTLLPSGTGILKYANWPAILKQLTPMYADVQALKRTPDDYGRQAAQIVNDNIFRGEA
jgi:multiple sugar transport system substrate-binding protein